MRLWNYEYMFRVLGEGLALNHKSSGNGFPDLLQRFRSLGYLEFMVHGSGLRVNGSGFRVKGYAFTAYDVRCSGWNEGFRGRV